ncbi:hypothetical protein [Bartonella sp. MM73XJBT.G]|uniref:hypothetical protein n=1 Tax=Bartonella sp. MM73XJBT.G TaxID=3019097 RepID=UPI00236088AF|nr:hypothetical protein [Bartonella sp. MM73XJBT.G]
MLFLPYNLVAKSIALWCLPTCFEFFYGFWFACHDKTSWQWVWLLLKSSKMAAFCLLVWQALCGLRLWALRCVCGREGGVTCGCCVPWREKDEACGAWAVMMRTVWGIVMRFMVAALPVVWVGSVFRVVFSDEILFMVLKHLCPRVCLCEKMVRSCDINNRQYS